MIKAKIRQAVKRVIEAVFDTTLIAKLDMKDSSVWLATWGGCGLVRYAPGTVGTLGGIPLALLLFAIGWPWLVMGFIIVFVIGYRASKVFETMSGEHDSKAIVIDEVAGILLTLIVATPNSLSILMGFLLFRIFDVLKPWPISWIDKKMPGALGVMLDDVLAGIFAALCLWGIRYAGLI